MTLTLPTLHFHPNARKTYQDFRCWRFGTSFEPLLLNLLPPTPSHHLRDFTITIYLGFCFYFPTDLGLAKPSRLSNKQQHNIPKGRWKTQTILWRLNTGPLLSSPNSPLQNRQPLHLLNNWHNRIHIPVTYVGILFFLFPFTRGCRWQVGIYSHI